MRGRQVSVEQFHQIIGGFDLEARRFVKDLEEPCIFGYVF